MTQITAAPLLGFPWEKSEEQTTHWRIQGKRASPGTAGMYSHNLGGPWESSASWVAKPRIVVGSSESNSQVHPRFPEELL